MENTPRLSDLKVKTQTDERKDSLHIQNQFIGACAKLLCELWRVLNFNLRPMTRD
jgi:hypothetical protein